jgi:putative redox protein
MTKATVVLNEGLRASVTIRQHTITVDEPVSSGGTDLGPTPTELVTAALGACAALTARLYAQRKGWPLERVEVTAEWSRFVGAEYAAQNPQRYQGAADVVNEFRQAMVFYGDLSGEQRARLLDIAGRCPVHKILTQTNIMIETLAAAFVDEELAHEDARGIDNPA